MYTSQLAEIKTLRRQFSTAVNQNLPYEDLYEQLCRLVMELPEELRVMPRLFCGVVFRDGIEYKTRISTSQNTCNRDRELLVEYLENTA